MEYDGENMNIKETLETVLRDYPLTSEDKNNTPFKNNELVALLSKGFPKYSNYFYNDQMFVSSGSAGRGRWATIPWICVFDSAISKSAQHGFYLVYLFSIDTNTVYLSLNQGWTFFREKYGKKEGLNKIQTVGDYFRDKLVYDRHEYLSKINLNSSSYKNTDLPEGYEYGNIFAKKYSIDEMPSNATLENDLKKMIVIIYQLQRCLIDAKNVESSINVILSEMKLENGFDNNKISEENDLSSGNIIQVTAPNKNLNEKEFTGQAHKQGMEVKQSTNGRLGKMGEDLVMSYEKNRLLKAGLKDLAYKVKHSSESEGDGLGYDIKSYDLDGSTIYIEVKSTTGEKNTPFFLSSNELLASKKYSEKYRLYRLFEIGSDNGTSFYIVKGFMNEKLNLDPVGYRALPK